MSKSKAPMSSKTKSAVMKCGGLGGGLGAIVGMVVAAMLGFDTTSAMWRIIGALCAGLGAGLGVFIGQRRSKES